MSIGLRVIRHPKLRRSGMWARAMFMPLLRSSARRRGIGFAINMSLLTELLFPVARKADASPIRCFILAVLLLFLCAATQAQTYSLGWGHVASGGGQGTAGSYTESGSIGLAGVSSWTSPLIYFNSQPQSITTVAGTTAAFTVLVAGTPPISYQWRRNGTNLTDGGNISGATTAALTLNNVQMPDSGSLDVVVSNPDGSITSSAATLRST